MKNLLFADYDYYTKVIVRRKRVWNDLNEKRNR